MLIKKTWFKTEIEISRDEIDYLTHYGIETNSDIGWLALFNILRIISKLK